MCEGITSIEYNDFFQSMDYVSMNYDTGIIDSETYIDDLDLIELYEIEESNRYLEEILSFDR